MATVKLYEIAHARAGDKGENNNIALFPYQDEYYDLLKAFGLFLGMMVPVIYPSKFSLFLSQALVGISQIFIHVNLQNLIGVLSMPKDRDISYSHFSLALGIGGVLGPAMGGI